MAKTITFKLEFEKKLKELKIKTKFVKYWKANLWEHSSPHYCRQAALSTDDWQEFIEFAFSWSLTSEGFDYWCDISEK